MIDDAQRVSLSMATEWKIIDPKLAMDIYNTVLDMKNSMSDDLGLKLRVP